MDDEKTRFLHGKMHGKVDKGNQPISPSADEHDRSDDADLTLLDDKTRLSGEQVSRGNSPAGPHEGGIDLDLYPANGPHRMAAAASPCTAGMAPGRLINKRFRLESVLGRGGMGVVYVARDLRKEELGDADSRLAIKLLSEKVQHLPNALLMLQQECAKAQGLAHPNIVTVYDFDRHDDVVYMTMELLKGQSLSEYMAVRKATQAGQAVAMDFSECFSIVTDIVQGLSYAHKRGIVHFDLKPGNIFITDAGTTKILDFGIARAVRTTGSENASNVPELDDMIALTPAFASLEMLHGMLPDPRDDVYALAIITYQLLAGKHPYGELPAIEALHKKRKPVRIPGLNDRQWRGLQKGLALARNDRTISAEAFLESLSPKRTDRRHWLATGAALTAIAASLFFWLQPPQIIAPSLFENPPAAAVLNKSSQQQVDDLLELADVHMLVGRLVSPIGANALDVYNQVLSIHPYDRRAIQGLKALLGRLAESAEQAMHDGEWHRAEELVDSGLKIYPQHKPLLAMKQQLIEKKS